MKLILCLTLIFLLVHSEEILQTKEELKKNCDSRYNIWCGETCCTKTHCCQEKCCKSYEVCVGGSKCCEKFNVCGNECCSEDEDCLIAKEENKDIPTCCKSENVCGLNKDVCCYPEKNEVCCNNQCCNGTCCQNQCCSKDQICCNDVCCGSDEICLDFYGTKKTQKCLNVQKNLKEEKKEKVKPIFEFGFLPVGSGDFSYIKCNQGKNKNKVILVEAGTFGSSVWKKNNLGKFVSSKIFNDVSYIDTVILNHKEDDYFSYVPLFFKDEKENEKLNQILISGTTEDYNGRIRKFLEDRIEKVKEINHGRPCFNEECAIYEQTNKILTCGNEDEGYVEILSGNVGRNSILLRLQLNDFKGLIFDKIETEISEIQEELEDKISDCSVLKLPNNANYNRIYGQDAVDDYTHILEITNPEAVAISGKANDPNCLIIGLLLTRRSKRIKVKLDPDYEDKEHFFQCSERGKIEKFSSWFHQIFSTSPNSENNYFIKFDVFQNKYEMSHEPIGKENFLSKGQEKKWNKQWKKDVEKRKKRKLKEQEERYKIPPVPEHPNSEL